MTYLRVTCTEGHTETICSAETPGLLLSELRRRQDEGLRECRTRGCDGTWDRETLRISA